MKSTLRQRVRRLLEQVPAAMQMPADLPPLWTPFPGKPQEIAYRSPAHEILFGGAAGAGKTGLAVGLALTKHHRSLILRRQAVQVGEIVEQLKRFSRGRARWSGKGHGGTLTTDDGRVVEVGGCDHEDRWDKYSGRPHDLIVFDESSTFTLKQVRNISAWNRHEDPRQLCQVLYPTNPPTTPEGRWVVEEFAPWLSREYPQPAKPGEIRWYSILDDKVHWLGSSEPFTHKGETIRPRSRTFIPGRLEDNPILSATDYGSKLQALPEPLRSQLLYGDFSLREEDNAWQCIPTAWVRAAMARWREQRPAGIKLACIGVDVARGGKDQTVLARRYGHWFDRLRKYPGKDTDDGPKVATLVLKSHEDDAAVHIDIIGVGGSAYDVLREQSWLTVRAVNNAEAKIVKHLRDRSGRFRFVNVRAASWWRLREALDPVHGDDLALPPDDELLADLCSPRYKVGVGGIQVEPKEDIVARLGRSPDCGDAVVLAHWSPFFAVQAPRALPLRTTPLTGKPRTVRTILCCGAEEAGLDLDGVSTLAVNIHAEPSNDVLDQVGQPMARVHVSFLDLDPKDYRDRWDEPLSEFGGKTITQAAIQPDEARLFVKAVCEARPSRWQTLLIVDDSDGRRAKSAACAAADLLAIPRTAIWWPGRDSEPQGVKPTPPNEYIHSQLKAARTALL